MKSLGCAFTLLAAAALLIAWCYGANGGWL